MEKIYLGIIIVYVLMKTVPKLLAVNRMMKDMGYRWVSIYSVPFLLRKISPLDFAEETNGMPLTFFNLAKGNTLWEQMQSSDDDKKLTPKEIKDKLDAARLICSKAVVYWPGKLKAEDFFNLKAGPKIAKIAWKLYNIVITYNFPTFKKCYEIPRDRAIHIAELCEKFGKKPHEHMKPDGKLSELESYMIDEFFFTHLLMKQNAQIEKQNNAIKKRNKK